MMSFKIGFTADKNPTAVDLTTSAPPVSTARKSLVQVYFEERERAYSYYNDSFDLAIRRQPRENE